MDADSKKNPPRRFRGLTAALIILAMLAAAYLLAPQTIGEQARRSLLCILQTHYAGMKVSIGSGHLATDIGLVLEDIEVSVPGIGNQPPRRLLHISRLIVETDLTISRMLDGQMPCRATRMLAVGVDAHLWEDESGKWSLARIWPPPKMGPGCPRFELYDARLSLYRHCSSADKTPCRPVEFDKLRLSVLTNPGASPELATHRFILRSTSEFVSQLTLAGDVSRDSIDLRGSAKDLRIEPALTSRIPMLSDETSNQLSGLTMLGDLEFAIKRTSKEPIDFLAKWTCNQGRYQHASLPQSFEEIRGVVVMRPGGVSVQTLRTKFGDSICQVSGATTGYAVESDLNLRVLASGLLINERVWASFPPSVQQSLDKVRPRGHLDLDSRLERLGGKWKADAVVDLHGIDVSIDKFPFPVSQMIGRVHFRDSQIWAEQLSGRVGAQRIAISFLRSLLGSGQPSWVRLAMDGPIPIDSMLLASLTPRGETQSKLEKFVRSLNPRGSVHLVDGKWNTDVSGQKSHTMDLRISDGNLRYIGFPYALYDVQGSVISQNTKVRLVDFTAKNSDNASIHCEGTFENTSSLTPRPREGDWRVGLHFAADNLPLDETIRAALPSDTQNTWDSLAPTGVLDSLDIQVAHAASYRAPQLLIAAKQMRRTLDRRTVSLRPTMLPYRLDIMEGSVRFDGQDVGREVVIESLDARHDATRLALEGNCGKLSSGQWKLDLNALSGSRLHPDSELVNSLPTQVRGAFQRLQLRGPLSIRGTTSILMPDAQHPEPTIDWGVTVQLEGNRIGDVGPVHDLRGEIAVQGKRDGQTVTANGTVSIDSMHFEDKQITSLQGPFAIRDDRLLLGETIALVGKDSQVTLPAKSISPIEGRLFGGVASLSGDVLLSNGSFDVTMGIRDGDVATILTDLGETGSTAIGKVNVRTRLEGTVGAIELLKGSGSGKLTGANLYQVPILVQVFNMLRVKPSEAVAFTDGEVRFAIYGENVTFNQIQLWGDLIALHGTGTMNRAKEVDLSFNTRVSPQNGWSQIMRPFGENQYTLWTIDVRGPLSEPAIERRALTTVNDTLERLFPGIADPVRPSSPVSNRIGNLRERLTK